MKDRKSRLRSQRGQSLIEVALLTPLLLSLMVGTIEMGRYAYLSILVGNAARAGAAYGSQSLALSVDASGHWVVMVSVQAQATFNALFKYPGIPASLTVTQTATMRVPNE
jgi:Flp pilus assembly protein TadG